MTSIMIIDDDDLLVRATEFALEEEGYEVNSALSGIEGLSKLKTAIPDLVLLDLMMPGMDGWKTLQKIKGDEIHASIPVIIVTAEYQTSDIQKNKEELGFSDYLTKPFDLDNLYSKIENALHS